MDKFDTSVSLLISAIVGAGVFAMPILANEQKALEELRERLLGGYRVKDMRIFGSKARGTDVDDSDVDVMIVLAECTPAIESEIDDLVFEINLKHGCLIVPLFFGLEELESGPLSEAPVYKRIISEGIQL